MKYDFVLSQTAIAALDSLRKFDQRRIRDALVEQLGHQPLTETRNRKKLRDNGPAQWELRIGQYRVFYDVDEEDDLVRVIAIGYKQGSKLTILGEEYEL